MLLCDEILPVTGGFPSQRVPDVENVIFLCREVIM